MLQAAAAEVVTALDGHRVLKIVQTDGASQLLLEILGFHDAALSTARVGSDARRGGRLQAAGVPGRPAALGSAADASCGWEKLSLTLGG